MTQETALSQLNSELAGVMDQALKNQWWNVICRLHEVEAIALKRFGDVLHDPQRFDRAIEE